MGLFSRKSADEKLADRQAKARRDAERAGVQVDGAVAVAHSLNRDRAYVTLVVWPDRVEIHNHGQVGSPMKEGKGSTVVPADKVSSVRHERDEGRSVVHIGTPGGNVAYWTSHEEAPALTQAILNILR